MVLKFSTILIINVEAFVFVMFFVEMSHFFSEFFDDKKCFFKFEIEIFCNNVKVFVS